MKYAYWAVCLPLVFPIAARAQQGRECPGTGVLEFTEGVLEVNATQNCSSGISSFTFQGVTVDWEERACPLSITWTPPWTKTGPKKDVLTLLNSYAHAEIMFFRCQKSGCALDKSRPLSGHYLVYEEIPCSEVNLLPQSSPME